MKTAIYAGTFDPLTNGHLDLIRRASRLFDRIVVGVASSQKKSPVFSADERIALCKAVCDPLGNVETIPFSGLLVDFAEANNALYVVRGIRSNTDFDYELQMTNMNREMSPHLETVFLTPSPALGHISGTLVREIAAMGGDVSKFVPPEVLAALNNRFTRD